MILAAKNAFFASRALDLFWSRFVPALPPFLGERGPVSAALDAFARWCGV